MIYRYQTAANHARTDEQTLENSRDKTSNTSLSDSPANAVGGSGFKGFNHTGREDTTTEVLRPQRDAAGMPRRIAMLGAVVLLLAVLGYIAYSRSHLSLNMNTEGGHSFAPPPQSQGD